MFYTYMLKSKKSERFYIGSTKDLRKCFKQHNENDARSREKFLKSGMGKRYLKTRLKRFLSLTG